MWKINRGQSAGLPVNSTAAKAPKVATGLTSAEGIQSSLAGSEDPSAERPPGLFAVWRSCRSGKAAGVPKSNASGINVPKTPHARGREIAIRPQNSRGLRLLKKINPRSNTSPRGIIGLLKASTPLNRLLLAMFHESIAKPAIGKVGSFLPMSKSSVTPKLAVSLGLNSRVFRYDPASSTN